MPRTDLHRRAARQEADFFFDNLDLRDLPMLRELLVSEKRKKLGSRGPEKMDDRSELAFPSSFSPNSLLLLGCL